MVKEIAFTAYPARDVAALRAWYEKHLGLAFDRPYAEDGVEKYNQAKLANGYFSLMTHEWADRQPGSASGITFEVHDLDAALADLRAGGVRVEDPHVTPVCKIASFDDPEGNRVTLHQITVPH